ncbi:DUF1822 family protein [Microseira wollei]|uniref:DUF1822 family protein n=1 Tax=Microseira wollei NIES-4236 TaxID=2530354 RepID=A0AAV3X7P6_9CYAN|nr:DUF1822 family protein [Microseira wollei]GET36675.1 hypothetical protein MiSe_14270 [Microseira wollei NIES-4236]
MRVNQSIINTDIEPWTFKVTLALSAHARAKQFQRYHSNPQKAKQVYLNTLAVYAVKFYLDCMGIETNWSASFSCNPLMQTILDVADLDIPKLGKLECRPVLPEDAVVGIPLEVLSDRIGYVAVQLDETLREATLLGFSKTVPNSGELAIGELRALPDLLEAVKPVPQPIQLSKWFENIFEAGWQSLSALLSTNQGNLAFRNSTSVASFRSNEETVKAAKLIDLGVELENQSVALLMTITPTSEQQAIVLVQVHPVGRKTLPANLKLSLLAAGKTVAEVQSQGQYNYIQLKPFRGDSGESFDIQVSLGEVSVTETFEI